MCVCVSVFVCVCLKKEIGFIQRGLGGMSREGGSREEWWAGEEEEKIACSRRVKQG